MPRVSDPAYAVNSWPSRIGIASCRCVRPAFTTSSNSRPFAANASRRFSNAFVNPASCERHANLMLVGIVSFVDCAILTWSFGCTGLYSPRFPPSNSLARFAKTSLTFMLCDVPAPAWYGSTMNCSRCCPARTSSAAFTIASASFGSSRPVSLWVSAAAFLIQTCASMNASSGSNPLIGKFCFARSVWTPYSASVGTSRGPSGSFSRRVSVIVSVL